jgi:hypothetical protein
MLPKIHMAEYASSTTQSLKMSTRTECAGTACSCWAKHTQQGIPTMYLQCKPKMPSM